MEPRLFAVFLGGRASKCNTELHDVVFVVGTAIEETYVQLMDKRFGDPLRLHVDSWMELRILDGYRVILRPERSRCSDSIRTMGITSFLSASCGTMRPLEVSPARPEAI